VHPYTSLIALDALPVSQTFMGISVSIPGKEHCHGSMLLGTVAKVFALKAATLDRRKLHRNI